MEISVIERAEREIEDLINREETSPDVRSLAGIMRELLKERRWPISYEMVLREIEVRFEATDERFRAVLQEINALRQEMNARFEAMNERFEALQREMNARFESLESRFRMILWWIPIWFTAVNWLTVLLLKLLKLI